MANYAPSVLATAQAILAKKYNAAELRRKQRPAVELALKNQDYAIPDHLSLKTADARALEVTYFVKRAAGVATAKAALHLGNKGDSAKVPVNYVRHVETFRVSRKQAQNNILSFQAMFNNEIEQAVLNVMDRHETSAIAYLIANRAQIAAPPTSGAGTWNATNFALEVAAANKTRYAQFGASFMMGRFYKPDYDVITDLGIFRELQFQAAQGASNSTNTAFQMEGLNIYPTTDPMLGAYTNGQGLWMPEGTFAGLNWTDPLNRSGVNEGAAVGLLGTMKDPFGSGAVLDISSYAVRADESAAQGNLQDIKDEWEVSLTIGYVLPPLTVVGDSPVHLIAQM